MEATIHHLGVSVEASDRFPQWSIQETREFLVIRAGLDQAFMETKRNKVLWEVVSSKMKEKGYNRSADQCKSKWKNLVTRYKGCETMETETMRLQFPFYGEIQSIFAARMHRMLWIEAEGRASGSSKTKTVQLSSDDDEEGNEGSDGGKGSGKKRRKNRSRSGGGATSSGGGGNKSLEEILEDFLRQQMQMNLQRRQAAEAREEERSMKEREWRKAMEALERERLSMEKSWREREEQRRIREEARDEKRDALITALLNKLRHGDM